MDRDSEHSDIAVEGVVLEDDVIAIDLKVLDQDRALNIKVLDDIYVVRVEHIHEVQVPLKLFIQPLLIFKILGELQELADLRVGPVDPHLCETAIPHKNIAHKHLSNRVISASLHNLLLCQILEFIDIELRVLQQILLLLKRHRGSQRDREVGEDG